MHSSPPISSKPPIVVFGDDWGRHVSTMQHLFRRILGRRRVIWVNAIGHRVPEIRDVGRAFEKARALVRRSPTPGETVGNSQQPDFVVQPRVLPWHHVPSIHRYNTASLLRSIRQALHQVAPGERPVLVTGSPPAVGVVGQLGEVASVYFCMDDFLHLPGVSGWMIGPLEERLLEKVDALVATARVLLDVKRPRSQRSHYLPQGVNYEHFALPRPEPADLAALPHPRILFAGGVSSCVSFGLLEQLSDAFPQASVVLVGPLTTSLNGFSRRNVHLMGPRPYDILPAYVQHCDVGIVPYLLNDWTMAVDPLKLLEYCAAGLPVVTTAIPEVRKYQDTVRVADTDSAFVRAVQDVLHGPRERFRERGQELARQHTWSHRADALLAIIDDIVARSAHQQVSHSSEAITVERTS